MGLTCPECGGVTSRVVIVQAAPDSLRRRRRCDRCAETFTTYERVDEPKRLTHEQLTDRLRKARAKIKSLQRTPEERRTDNLLARANREKKR